MHRLSIYLPLPLIPAPIALILLQMSKDAGRFIYAKILMLYTFQAQYACTCKKPLFSIRTQQVLSCYRNTSQRWPKCMFFEPMCVLYSVDCIHQPEMCNWILIAFTTNPIGPGISPREICHYLVMHVSHSYTYTNSSRRKGKYNGLPLI